MITMSTWERRDLFRNEGWANLLINTIYHYRGSAYLLHELVVSPDHLHILMTPLASLEKAAQFIKGGSSYRAKRELGSNVEIWQQGFSDHRIRDASDYRLHTSYIHQNPVRKHLCELPEQYPYSSASSRLELDGVPQGLKPGSLETFNGAAKAAPFQNNTYHAAPEGAPFQSSNEHGQAKSSAFRGASATDSTADHIQPAVKDSK